jgi:hypothetical protein
MHLARLPCSLAFAKAGKSNPARMAIIAITTSISTKVNAGGPCRELFLPTSIEYDCVCDDAVS